MIHKKIADTIAEKLGDKLTDPLIKLTPIENIREAIKDSISRQLAKMDMVPREEFDIQCLILQKTRQKVDAMEVQLQQLQALLEQANHDSPKID